MACCGSTLHKTAATCQQQFRTTAKALDPFVFDHLYSYTGQTLTFLTGRVVKVADGDTVTLLDASNVQHNIRISGIAARERKQPFGAASKKYMSALAFGKEAEALCYKRDRYKRKICIVYLNGEDVALAQLDAGMAWWYR